MPLGLRLRHLPLVLALAVGPAFAGPPVTLVPEMARIPALDAQPGDHRPLPPVPGPFLAAWRAVEPRVQAELTPAAVRLLSRWAKVQMESYARTPATKGAAFHVVRAGKDGLVLEATLDTLPTHSAVVTRWLKVIVACDPTGALDHVWITIRGEALE